MPEPLDTIRRVNSDEPMSAEELRQACATLDRHAKGRKTDVLQARRRAEQRLEKLTGAPPSSAAREVSSPDATDSAQRSAQPRSGGSGAGRFVVLLLVVVAVVYACSRLGGNDSGGSSAVKQSAGAVQEVSRAEFEADGRTWPLTVDRGTLRCEPANRVIFTVDGTTYSVNGTAKGAHQWAEIDPIWADDGSGLGLKVDIGDLIGAGLALCK